MWCLMEVKKSGPTIIKVVAGWVGLRIVTIIVAEKQVKISVIILCNSLTQMKFKQSSSRFHLGLNKVGSS